MNINRNNYEEFFLDHMEGRLDPVGLAELHLFLEENPDLKEEFASAELISIPETDEQLPFRELLKVPFDEGAEELTGENADIYLIAQLEGDLNENGIRRTEEFIAKNPSLLRDQELYLATRLEPETVLFPDKQSLKRQTRRISLWPYAAGIAASLLILFALLIPGENSTLEIAVTPVPPVTKPVEVTATDTTQQTVKFTPETVVTAARDIPSRTQKTPPRRTERQPLTPPATLHLQPAQGIQAGYTAQMTPRAELTPITHDIIAAQIIRSEEMDSEENMGDFLPRQTHPAPVLAGIISGGAKAITTEGEKSTLWNLAVAGIRNLGRLTDSNLKLERSVSESGKVNAINLHKGETVFTVDLATNP